MPLSYSCSIDASLGLILYIVMPNNFIFLGEPLYLYLHTKHAKSPTIGFYLLLSKREFSNQLHSISN